MLTSVAVKSAAERVGGFGRGLVGDGGGVSAAAADAAIHSAVGPGQWRPGLSRGESATGRAATKLARGFSTSDRKDAAVELRAAGWAVVHGLSMALRSCSATVGRYRR